MSADPHCPNCGAVISQGARFCESCGVPQERETETFTQEAPPSDRTTPQVAEFGQLLRDYSQMPGVQMALLASLIGAGVVLVAAFLLAALTATDSLVHYGLDEGSELFKETLAQAATTTLATTDVSAGDVNLTLRTAPLLFALIPLAGCALGAAVLADRTRGLPSMLRYAWGAAVGIPFALQMLLLSLLAGTFSEGEATLSPTEGSVVLLSLLWGATGGIVGVWTNRDSTPLLNPTTWPGRILITAREALRPLAASLLVLGAIGVGLWSTQTVRDSAEARGDRSLATAAVDNVLFAGDLGYRYQALGSGAEFELFNGELLRAALSGAFEDEEDDDGDSSSASYSPVPLSESKTEELVDAEGFDALDAKYRIFDFGDVLPAYAFAPLLLLLITVPALLALYAGFAVARANAASTLPHGAAWGATVGPLWALAMAVLTGLTQDVAFGQVDGDSLFVVTLLLGAAIGAVGGLGAVRQRPAA